MKKKGRKQTVESIVEWAEANKLDISPEYFRIPGLERLTDNKRKILLVSVLPETSGRTQEERARIVGVSARYLRQVLAEDGIPELMHKVVRAMFAAAVPQVASRYVRNALRGGKEGDGDRLAQERLLEQAGVLYRPDSKKAGDTHIHGDVNVHQDIRIEAQKQVENLTNRIGKILESTGEDY